MYHLRKYSYEDLNGTLSYFSYHENSYSFYEGETFISLAVLTVYVIFVHNFLSSRSNFKYFDVTVKYLVNITLLFCVTDIFIGIFTNTHFKFIEIIFKSVVCVLALVSIILGLNESNGRLAQFIILGSIFFLVGTFLSSGIAWIGDSPRPARLFFSKAGILLEVFFSQLGLGIDRN